MGFRCRNQKQALPLHTITVGYKRKTPATRKKTTKRRPGLFVSFPCKCVPCCCALMVRMSRACFRRLPKSSLSLISPLKCLLFLKCRTMGWLSHATNPSLSRCIPAFAALQGVIIIPLAPIPPIHPSLTVCLGGDGSHSSRCPTPIPGE